MKHRRYSHWGVYFLAAACFSLSTSAIAAKDIFYPRDASATVNAASVAVTNNLTTGNDGATTLNNPVNPANTVSVTATWAIDPRHTQPGADTSYSQTATFSVATMAKPAGAADVSVGSIPSCSLSSSGSTCTTVITFSAPETLGSYQVKVTPDGLGGNDGLGVKTLAVNFSVAEAIVQKYDTQLTVAKQCVLLHQGVTPLTATLKEMDSQAAISGADINFYLDPDLQNGVQPVTSIGNATTDASGLASLSYDVSGLEVGDYGLYAEYGGNSAYNASNDSDLLGVSYVFAGFRQPINAEGNSIFGGRVIPIKIKLLDANGAPVTDAQPTVWLTTYSAQGLGEVLEQVSSVSAADTGNTMRYAPEEQQYIYNWDATDLANGTYAVVVNLGDSSACRPANPYAMITVAKKGKK